VCIICGRWRRSRRCDVYTCYRLDCPHCNHDVPLVRVGTLSSPLALSCSPRHLSSRAFVHCLGGVVAALCPVSFFLSFLSALWFIRRLQSPNETHPPQITTALMNSPLAPLDPEYPFLPRYPSPECDALEALLSGNHPPSKCRNPRIHSSNNGEEEAQDFALRLPHPCPPTSPAHQDKGDFLAFPEMASSSCYPSLLAGDHYGRSYSDGLHGFDDSGFHSSSQVHVLVSSPSNMDAHPLRTGKIEPSLRVALNIDASLYSPHFSPGHRLNSHFVPELPTRG
jgi:hypothetical protein